MSAADCAAFNSTSGGRTLAHPGSPLQYATACFFCAHAILGNDVLQVPDALQDDRFADNPLVTSEPRVRFYAGAPLMLKNGTHAGTLCVIDHRARNLDDDQLQLLRDLAKLVESGSSRRARPALEIDRLADRHRVGCCTGI
jgi:GAF domain-containing protein